MKRMLFGGLLILSLIFTLLLSFNCMAASQSSKSPDTSIVITYGAGANQLNVIDPHEFGNAFFVVGNVFDLLIDFDVNGKLQPRLAKNWEYSADKKTITFKLRQDIKFSSGDPLTAKDVVWSYNRVSSLQNPFMNANKTAQFINVEALDDYTVAFHLGVTSATFLREALAAFYISSEAYFNRVGEKEFSRLPVGTGPYIFTGWEPGQYVDFEYNESYWGDIPQVKKVRVLASSDVQTDVKMLQAGEVDMITYAPYQSIPSLKNAGYNVTKTLGMGGAHAQALEFCCINPDTPWSDPRVRKAINYAIDKDSLIKILFNSVPLKVEWLFPWELGYDPNLISGYPYNLEKAKQLMAEAGYPDGFDFEVIFISDVPGISDQADYIASALKKININVKLSSMTFGKPYFDKKRELSGDKTSMVGAMLHETSGPGNADSALNLSKMFYSLTPRKSNLFGTPELDMIIKEALSTTDDTQRAELIKKAYKIIDENCPLISICATTASFVMKSNINYTPTTTCVSKTGMLKDIAIK